MSETIVELYQLPENWKWTTIQELGQVVSGGTPSTRKPEYWGGETAWITPADLSGYNEKYIEGGAKSITREGLKNSSARLMPPGSIHFSSRAPIGYVVISKKAISTNQGFKSLVPAEGVFNEYVYYYLKSAKQLAEKRASGTTFKELSGKVFSQLPIPIPPLNEQRRIVAKIEELFSELDAGVAALEQARAQLKRYRQALLKAAFEGRLTEQWRQARAEELEPAGALLARIRAEREARWRAQLAEWEEAVQAWEAAGKPGKKPRKPRKPKELPPLSEEERAALPGLPEGWAYEYLGAIAEISGGITKNQKRKNLPLQVPFLRVANVYANRLELEKVDVIGVTQSEVERTLLQPGDLLIVEGNGSIEQIGRVAMWNGEVDICLHQNHLIKARLLPQAMPKFVLYFLLSELGRKMITTVASSTSGLHTLSLSKVSKLIIPLCSLDEQKEIVGFLESHLSTVDHLDQAIAQSLAQAAGLRQAILKKAFSGRLVPQDAEDEPASVLLERIRTGYTSH